MDATLSSGWDARRLAYAVGAVALLASAITVFVNVDAGWWVFPVFAIGPDLAFLAGIGQPGTLERGQMPSRAVPVYNAFHRIWGPLALGLIAFAGFAPSRVSRRGARVGLPHLLRPGNRLRVAHPRWLPALLTISPPVPGRSSRQRA